MRFIKKTKLMKTKIILSIASAVLVFSSCSVDKTITVDQHPPKTKFTIETGSLNFVVTKNGETIYFKNLELIKGPFASPHLLADKKIKFQCSDIIAYQNSKHYAVSQNLFSSGKKSFVSTEALPGFAVRTVKGKINVYCKKYFNGNNSVNEFYIQSGNEGKIYAYNPKLMAEMINENEMAASYFNDAKNEMVLSEKIRTTAEIYNNATSMTKN